MSMLDTFTILFEADTHPLETGLEGSRASVDELVQRIRQAEQQTQAAAQGMGRALGGVSGEVAIDTAAAEAAIDRVQSADVDLSGAVEIETRAAEAGVDRVTDALGEAGGAGRQAGREGSAGLEQIEQQAGQTDTSIKALAGSIVAMVGTFLALDAAGGKFSETVAELEAIGRTADALGLPVEDVDAFGRAMQTMGGDAKDARDSLVDMAESMGEALQDAESGRAEVYAKLGISLRDANGEAINATEGILRLADAVQGMSQEEAIFRIKELGITDNRTVEMVLKGRQELERMLGVQKEQSSVNKEAIENARRYTEALNGFRASVGSAGQGIMQALIPALTAVVGWLRTGMDWAREHSDVIVAFLGTVAAAVAVVYLPAMASAAAATLAATWPLIAMGAAIAAVAAAFALAYDDVMNFIDGNDSLIGQIFEKFPGLESAVVGVIAVVRQAWDGIRSFGAGVLEALAPLADAFGGVFASMGNMVSTFFGILADAVGKIVALLGVDLTGAFQAMGGAVGMVMDGVVATIKTAVGIITGALNLASAAIDKVAGAASSVAGFLGIGGDGEEAAQGVTAGQQAVAQANAAPLNAVTSSAISNTVASTNRETNVQVGEVVVNTQATDAEGIARDVGGSLNEQLAQVDAEFSTGVAR